MSARPRMETRHYRWLLFYRGERSRNTDRVNQFAHHEASFDSDLSSARRVKIFPTGIGGCAHRAEKRVPTGGPPLYGNLRASKSIR